MDPKEIALIILAIGNHDHYICFHFITIVALIMVLIGISQLRTKDKPVGFYNVINPPKKEDVTDIIAWNRKQGMIWIVYGICIELGFWLGSLLTNEMNPLHFLYVSFIIAKYITKNNEYLIHGGF